MGAIINGVTVPDGNDFKPVPSIVRAAEMTNGYGEVIGDYVKTRYSIPFAWDMLDDDTRDSLIAATDPEAYPTFSATFPTLAGDRTSVCRVTSPLFAKRLKYSLARGKTIWTEVTLTLEEV